MSVFNPDWGVVGYVLIGLFGLSMFLQGHEMRDYDTSGLSPLFKFLWWLFSIFVYFLASVIISVAVMNIHDRLV